MAYSSLVELASALGVESLPKRWAPMLEDSAREDCPMAYPEFYREISRKYGLLGEHLEVYCRAADEIRASEAEYTLFRLLLRALDDRAHIADDLALMHAAFDGGSLARRMMPALAMTRSCADVYAALAARGLPEQIITASMRLPEAGVEVYKSRHGGEYGFSNFDWFQLAYDAKLISIGGLTYELPCEFPNIADVYLSRDGEIVSLANGVEVHREGYPLGTRLFEDGEGSFLADITRTAPRGDSSERSAGTEQKRSDAPSASPEEYESITGHPYNERGLIERRTVTLDRERFRLVLSGGSPVVSIHIPREADISREAADRSLAEAEAVIARCYPEYRYSAFIFESWMMDHRLPDLIGRDKKITQFASRFTPLAMKSSGLGIFGFVFNKPSSRGVDIASLEEKTSLMRALKRHYRDGGAIYEMCGFKLARSI